MTDDRDDFDAVPAPFPTQTGFPPMVAVAAQDPSSDWTTAADPHDLPMQRRPPATVHPLARLSRFAFPPSEAPDDEGMAARDRRWTSRTIGVAVAFLLVFNAASIRNWARQQPAGWLPETAARLSEVWSAQIAQLGADQPREVVRDAYGRLRDQRFIASEARRPIDR